MNWTKHIYIRQGFKQRNVRRSRVRFSNRKKRNQSETALRKLTAAFEIQWSIGSRVLDENGLL